MLLVIIRMLYATICAGAIAAYVRSSSEYLPAFVINNTLPAFFMLLFATQAVTVLDTLFRRKSIENISAIYFGLLVGILLGWLLMLGLTPVLVALGAAAWASIINVLAIVMLS